MLNIEQFISTHITKRSVSMFASSVYNNQLALYDKINNKSVLVIGGAGSIGSSFIKALLPFKPSKLVVADANENALAELTRSIRSDFQLASYVPREFLLYPIDYASSVFEKLFRNTGGFDVVANFSAHKHVRSEKDIYSIEALIRNNLLNARRLLDLLAEYSPESYFCVSTDKAANPVNIMGASKRIMEDVISSYSDYFPVKTARFANVAFSNGSLLDAFLKRIEKLQPLSAPLDVRRYFVSPEEAGQICLLAAILGQNREIFFPKLNEAQMMRFDDIARQLLQELGYSVLECSSDKDAIKRSEELKFGGREYPVHFSVSDTSGEKSFEEFVTDYEETDMKRFDSLGVIINKPMPNKDKINALFANFETVFNGNKSTTKEEIVRLLTDYLPNFEHIETGKSLDSKM